MTPPEPLDGPAHLRWLAVALTVAAIGLAGCGGDEDEGGTTPAPDVTGSDLDVASQSPTPDPVHRGEPILIKTRIRMFAGKVLAGSVIGDSPFCPSGTVHHEHGSPDIGFPAINVFGCPDGQLKIGFGPGPDQMNNTVQTSDWEILDGTGRFAGITGNGQMIVQWPRIGAPTGQETFTGTVTHDPGGPS